MMKRQSFQSLCLLALPLALVGCQELQVLRERNAAQEERIRQLQEENRQFQEAYYQIKQTMDSELGETGQRVITLERELEQARNLRTQRENELSNQVRARTLELEALRTEMEEQRTLNEARINQLERLNLSLTAERNAAMERLTQREEQLRQERASVEELTERVAGLTVDLEAARENLSSIESELETSRQALRDREAEVTRLNGEVETLRTQLDELRTRAEEIEQERDQIKADQETLTQQVAQLEQALAEARESAQGTSELQETNRKLEQQVEELRQQLESLRAQHEEEITAARAAATPDPLENATLADDPDLIAARDRVTQSLAELGADSPAAAIQVELAADGLHLRLPSDALFQTGTVVLAPEAGALLDPVAQFLGTINNRDILIEGHTDNQPVESLPFADNWGLGFARADRVREYLMRQGNVPASRLIAQTRAGAAPVADNGTPEGRARNRRVEIIIGRRR